MEADSFWRCTGSSGVRPSVESGKDTKAKELMEAAAPEEKRSRQSGTQQHHRPQPAPDASQCPEPRRKKNA